MPAYEMNFSLPRGDRDVKRRALIECFLNEESGSGAKNLASRYQYNVEDYGEYGIYLKRPTQLNKGFDFTVNIRGLYFKKNRRYSNPSHNDIIDALQDTRAKYPDEYRKVELAIRDIYNCIDADFEDIHAGFSDYEGTEHPIQIILLAIKWLFMEQDCAYWNYSGRRMFYAALVDNGLV